MLKKLLLASAISMALISTSTYAADAAVAGKTEQAAKKSATNIAVVNLITSYYKALMNSISDNCSP